MNEVTNQSLQANAVRTSVVSPTVKGNTSERSGKNLPSETQAQEKTSNRESSAESMSHSVKHLQEKIQAAVAEMNKYTQTVQRDLQFNVDDTSGRTVVSVVDRESQKVIRQIPDEIFLRLARTAKENLASGNNDALQLISIKA